MHCMVHYEKKRLKKSSFQVGMVLQKVRNLGKDVKNSTKLPHYEMLAAYSLSSLQCNALAFLVHFVTYTTKWTRDASALRWRPERRLPSFRSRVVFLYFLIPALFLSFLQV